MMKDAVAETCATVGTGSFALGGALNAGFNTFATRFTSGVAVYYFAKTTQASLNGPKYEYGVGTFTSPSTVTRADVKLSSNANAAVSWLSTDTYIVYSAASADALAALLIGNMATSKPTWAQAGFEWLDSTAGIGTRLIRKLWNGSADVETGRYEGTPAVYVPSPRLYFRDTGTSGATVAATDVGNCIDCDVTLADRAVTLPAGATLGHGFSVWVYGYGSTGNSVVLTPGAGEKINEGSVGATKSIPGGVLTRVIWDGAKGAWRTGA